MNPRFLFGFRKSKFFRFGLSFSATRAPALAKIRKNKLICSHRTSDKRDAFGSFAADVGEPMDGVRPRGTNKFIFSERIRFSEVAEKESPNRKNLDFLNPKRNRGFTLIETIMAMVIMSTGILLLVNTWGGSFVRLERTQKSFEIAALLERKMIDYEIKYRGKNIDSIPESEDGDFEGYPDFKWTMTSKKLEFPDIGAALSARDGGVDNMTEMVVKQLTETLKKSIKEVTISIIYSRPKKKELSYSITTYFVDYDKGGSLGIPGGGGG